MTDKLWNSIEAKTIAKCFKKAGFVSKVKNSYLNAVGKLLMRSMEVDSIDEEWRIVSNALQVDAGTTFKDFFKITVI